MLARLSKSTIQPKRSRMKSKSRFIVFGESSNFAATWLTVNDFPRRRSVAMCFIRSIGNRICSRVHLIAG